MLPDFDISTFWNGTLAVGGGYAYVSKGAGANTVRINLADNTLTYTTPSVNLTANSFYEVKEVILMLNDDAYWIANGADTSTLVKWEKGALGPEPIGDYFKIGNNQLPTGYYDNSFEHEQVLFAGETFYLPPGAQAPLAFPAVGDLGFLEGLISDGENTMYLTNEFEGVPGYQAFRISEGNLEKVPFKLESSFVDEVPTLNPNEGFVGAFGQNFQNGARLVNYFPNFDGSNEQFLARILPDSILLTQLSSRQDLISVGYSNARLFSVEYELSAEGSVSHVFFDYDHVELYSMTIPEPSNVLYADESGAWVESNDPTTFQPKLQFYAAAGAVTEMTYQDGVRAYQNPQSYLLNEKLLFVGATLEFGNEWMVADPLSGTVSLLKDINPGANTGAFRYNAIAEVPGGLIFAANDGQNGSEPWFTDGTPEGTVLLGDINPGEASSSISSSYANLNGTIFFAANGPNGYEVYRMGEETRTPELVIDLNEGPRSSFPYGFFAQGDDLLFFARGAVGDTYELYRIALSIVPTEATPSVTPAKVFPNPVGDRPFTVEAPSGEAISHLELFDQTGRKLKEVRANRGAAVQFDLGEAPVGTYWLRTWYTSGRFSINAVQRGR